MTDDSVFTEEGSSASQLTAKVLDFAGQASDTVSAYAQVKVEDAPKLLKRSESECPATWIRPPRLQWPKKKGRKFKNQMFLSGGICTVTHEQDFWERQFEKA